MFLRYSSLLFLFFPLSLSLSFSIYLSLSLFPSVAMYVRLIPKPINIGERRVTRSDIFLLSLSGTAVVGRRRERVLNAISLPSRPCFCCSRRLSRVNPEILSWMTLYPAANAPFLRTPAVIAAILITPRARGVISSGVNAKTL